MDIQQFIGRRVTNDKHQVLSHTPPAFYANGAPLHPGERPPTIVDLGDGYYYACPAGWNAPPERHAELAAYVAPLIAPKTVEAPAEDTAKRRK